MLVIVHNSCHVPHGSRITTCGTIFTEILFTVSFTLRIESDLGRMRSR